VKMSERRVVSADREVPPSSERERARARTDRRRQAGPTGLREGERVRERMRGRR
jgi:hypothetical protein